MATILPNAAIEAGAPARNRVREFLREPLLHFVVLGAVLFGADHLLSTRADDPRAIVVTTQVDQEARELFQARRNRAPNAQELEALRRVWLDNEVLYREGLALQVDRGDSAIRERVIFKALSVVDASLKPQPADEAALRAWFEKNRAKYDEPPRYDFQEAMLYDNASEAALREFADALNKGTPGDTKAGLRVFKGRPHGNIVESYGADFARALEESPAGQWRVHAAGNTWRLMRLEGITAGKPAAFEQFRGVVMHDRTDALMAEQRTAAVRALAKKYAIRYEGTK